MQVLERLAASVPYANACVNAEAKLDHVTGRCDLMNDMERSAKCPLSRRPRAAKFA